MKMLRADCRPMIMIVDDLRDSLQMVGRVIRSSFDCDITFAVSGSEALSEIEAMLADEIAPDLILLDVIMPQVGGLEVCRRLKENQRTRDIPVIFLTAKGDSEDILAGFEAGAVDYVPKPFVVSELVARVRTQLYIERQNSFRKEMLHVLCHDLLSPFGGIIGAMEMIDGYNSYLKYSTVLRKLGQSGIDVISLARYLRILEEQGLTINDEPEPLHTMAENAFTPLSEQYKQKNIRFVNNIDERLLVRCDSEYFVDMVLGNLLSNAMKFSNPGQTVTMSAEKIRGMIRMECRDEGIGMPETLCRDLFDILRPKAREGTNGEPGHGLGLPLSAKVVELLGGKMYVGSTVGKGSVFRIELKDCSANAENSSSDENLLPLLKRIPPAQHPEDPAAIAIALRREYLKPAAELQRHFSLNRLSELANDLAVVAIQHRSGSLAAYLIKLLDAIGNVDFVACSDLLDDLPVVIDDIQVK